jgi:hypothetical protein
MFSEEEKRQYRLNHNHNLSKDIEVWYEYFDKAIREIIQKNNDPIIPIEYLHATSMITAKSLALQVIVNAQAYKSPDRQIEDAAEVYKKEFIKHFTISFDNQISKFRMR